jgi:hypothetical protein
MATNVPKKSSLKKPLDDLYGVHLSIAEIAECERNFFGFFELLHQIDNRNKTEDTSNEY